MNKKYQKTIPNAKKSGFTLIELLVVVLIIGILAAVALPQYQKTVEKARATEALTNLRALVSAQDVYRMSNGAPTNDFTKLDIALSGETTDDGYIRLAFFTYRLSLNPRGSGFEVIATRNLADVDLLKYYIYYDFDGEYNCVAKTEKAKNICAAVCGRSGFLSNELGNFYCSIG